MKMTLRQNKFEVLVPTGLTNYCSITMDDLKPYPPGESLVINVGQTPEHLYWFRKMKVSLVRKKPFFMAFCVTFPIHHNSIHVNL